MFSAAVQLTLKYAVVVMVHKHNLVIEMQEEGRCLWLYISYRHEIPTLIKYISN